MPSEQWLSRQIRRTREVIAYGTGAPAARRDIEREWFFRLASRFTPTLSVDSDLGRITVNTKDRHVGLRTFVNGGYDSEVISRVFAALDARSPAWRTGTIAEVGANIGTTTVLLAREAPVIAFEPVPENVRLLGLNVLQNDLQERVTIKPVALSDREGSVTMELHASNSGDHRVRLSNEPGLYDEQDRETVEVPAVRMDDEVQGSQLSLVWMDAQGHEAQVLAGAPSVLAGGVPMVIEYFPYALRRAGGLELLEQLVAEHFSLVVDLSREGRAMEISPADVFRLRDRYPTHEHYTDLLLLP